MLIVRILLIGCIMFTINYISVYVFSILFIYIQKFLIYYERGIYMIYKVSGFNKFSYKDKRTGADRQAIVVYGLRQPNAFESRSPGFVGLIAENRFIAEEQLKLIPKGGFELGKCYEFKFESDDGRNVSLSSISLTDDF